MRSRTQVVAVTALVPASVQIVPKSMYEGTIEHYINLRSFRQDSKDPDWVNQPISSDKVTPSQAT